MISKETVIQLVDEWLEGKDYFLVEVSVNNDGRIVVEIDHSEGVWIEDCVELSRYLQQRMGPEADDYELEVGSAGIGQPFKVKQQYMNHVGSEVETLTRDGRKLQGVLKSADDNGFVLTVTQKVKPEGAKRPRLEEVDMPLGYEEVSYTKYLIRFK